MVTTPKNPDDDLIYQQLCDEWATKNLTHPDQLRAEIAAGLEELRAPYASRLVEVSTALPPAPEPDPNPPTVAADTLTARRKEE